MSAFSATGISLSAWWVTPKTVFPPPPPCPLANIFCSPAHMVMTFSLKVCGTVTLRIRRTVTWMTTRWATHKSNQKRLVTENRANSQCFIIVLHLPPVCHLTMWLRRIESRLFVPLWFVVYVKRELHWEIFRILEKSIVKTKNRFDSPEKRNLHYRMQCFFTALH